MKILCVYTDCGPSYVRTGWGRVFAGMGHEFFFWQPAKKPAFDIFNEVEPDIFIGTTYDLDEAQLRCIKNRPNLKVALYASAWGPLVENIDLKQYPIVVVNDNEKRQIERLHSETGRPNFVFIHCVERNVGGLLSGWESIGVQPEGILNAADIYSYVGGQHQDALASDVAFIGGYWPYKARNIDKYLLTLCHPYFGFHVKIWGNSRWPVANYLGRLPEELAKHVFASAKVCLNISEPHSTDLGFDIIERPFKTLAAGGFCLSDYCGEMDDIFGLTLPTFRSSDCVDDVADLICHYIENQDERERYADAGRELVLGYHTYHDRVAQMLTSLGLPSEAEKALVCKANFLKEHL